MATSFEPIKFANLTEKTTAPSDADIIVIEDSTATKKAKWSNLISWIKSKLNIGSADISSIGDGTVTGAINTLNTKIGIFYLAESLLTPAVSGDTTLATLIRRLSSKGYLYGQASIMSYPELPVQSWTYTVRWQFTFDNNSVAVEIQQLYYAAKYTRWLNLSTGTWATDSWS